MIAQVQADVSREFDLAETQDSIRAELEKLKSLNHNLDLGIDNQILPNFDQTPNLPMQGYYFLLGAHARARRLPKAPWLPDMSKDRLLSEHQSITSAKTQDDASSANQSADHAADSAQ